MRWPRCLAAVRPMAICSWACLNRYSFSRTCASRAAFKSKRFRTKVSRAAQMTSWGLAGRIPRCSSTADRTFSAEWQAPSSSRQLRWFFTYWFHKSSSLVAAKSLIHSVSVGVDIGGDLLGNDLGGQDPLAKLLGGQVGDQFDQVRADGIACGAARAGAEHRGLEGDEWLVDPLGIRAGLDRPGQVVLDALETEQDRNLLGLLGHGPRESAALLSR